MAGRIRPVWVPLVRAVHLTGRSGRSVKGTMPEMDVEDEGEVGEEEGWGSRSGRKENRAQSIS